MNIILDIFNHGTMGWFVDNEHHNNNGPAIIWHDGLKEYYCNGLLHRIDGPALEYANGDRYWFINGTEYNELEYWLFVELFNNRITI